MLSEAEAPEDRGVHCEGSDHWAEGDIPRGAQTREEVADFLAYKGTGWGQSLGIALGHTPGLSVPGQSPEL